MIALILGGSPAVWAELAEAEALLGRRKRLVVAVNLAGIHYPGRLEAICTHHPEHVADWLKQRRARGYPAPGRIFTLKPVHGVPDAEIAEDHWRGSSGLYAVQVALEQLGATAVIGCGIPMDSEAGHFTRPEGTSWENTGGYRLGFIAALPLIGGRVRFMGEGWTAGLYGKPTAEWVAAIDNIKPLGVTAPQRARSEHMHHVKNNGKAMAKFWARDQQSGLMVLHRLRPGQAVDAEIDPNQPRFTDGDLSVTVARERSAPKAAASKRTARKPAAPATHRPLKAPAPPAEG